MVLRGFLSPDDDDGTIRIPQILLQEGGSVNVRPLIIEVYFIQDFSMYLNEIFGPSLGSRENNRDLS